MRGMARFVLSLGATYLISNALYAAFDFQYDVFNEKFNFLKLIADLSIWVGVFGLVYYLLGLLFEDQSAASENPTSVEG